VTGVTYKHLLHNKLKHMTAFTDCITTDDIALKEWMDKCPTAVSMEYSEDYGRCVLVPRWSDETDQEWNDTINY